MKIRVSTELARTIEPEWSRIPILHFSKGEKQKVEKTSTENYT